jgi:hypothetical protein
MPSKNNSIFEKPAVRRKSLISIARHLHVNDRGIIELQTLTHERFLKDAIPMGMTMNDDVKVLHKFIDQR